MTSDLDDDFDDDLDLTMDDTYGMDESDPSPRFSTETSCSRWKMSTSTGCAFADTVVVLTEGIDGDDVVVGRGVVASCLIIFTRSAQLSSPLMTE